MGKNHLTVVNRLMLLLLLSAGACAGLRSAPPLPDRSQDERILREVEARLAAEPSLRGNSLRVEVEGGRVHLFGSVAGVAALQCAVRNAELVAGVQGVVEFLVLERGPREARCLMPRQEVSLAPRQVVSRSVVSSGASLMFRMR